jgi:aldehyde dehydrogenase
MTYVSPGTTGSIVEVAERYDNFIGGKWVPPHNGEYMTDLCPATDTKICEVARSSALDVEDALDAAHVAAADWGHISQTERAVVLNKIADAIDANREMLAVAESWENGKPVRETLNADIPLAADHFRYFASAARGLEGSLTVIDDKTTAYHYQEPLGVVGQIIPFNFPLLTSIFRRCDVVA